MAEAAGKTGFLLRFAAKVRIVRAFDSVVPAIRHNVTAHGREVVVGDDKGSWVTMTTAETEPNRDEPAPSGPGLVADRTEQISARAVPRSSRQALLPGEVPPPPLSPARARRARSKAARNSLVVFLSGCFTVATLAALVFGAAVYAGKIEYERSGPLAEVKVVQIPPRASLDSIADTLAKNGVITTDWVFIWGAWLTGTSSLLKPGEYEFKPQVSMRDVADQLVDGKVVLHPVTFPEGWTSEQIIQRLVEKPELQGRIVAIPEEGSLSPDTYRFARGYSREQLIDLMKRTQEKRLAEAWAKRSEDLPIKTPKELVILASIVEKETSKPEERARIAAVFVNRLRKGMRLETDPTILYGLYGGKAWTESRTLTRADLAAPNPYNTYRINGLPPGPIANPGRAAMEAVANPTRSNELFFVADGTGGHAFAETFEEHQRNVQRWRQIEQSRKASESSILTMPAAADTAAPAGASVATPAPTQQGRPAANTKPATTQKSTGATAPARQTTTPQPPRTN
jgi:UPF0755 protein